MKETIFTADHLPSKQEVHDIVLFFLEHLGPYGDSKEDILKAINYALKTQPQGGFILTFHSDEELCGASIINRTGMTGYIPENILVYIAIHKEFRMHGYGQELLRKTIEHCEGDIALHVAPSNPAVNFFESFGFENPYLEMRLKR